MCRERSAEVGRGECELHFLYLRLGMEAGFTTITKHVQYKS
jgi:hypothetical protein